jgi:hypothetical protein
VGSAAEEGEQRAGNDGGETGGPAHRMRHPQRRGGQRGGSSASKRVSTTPVGEQSLHLRCTTTFRAAGAAEQHSHLSSIFLNGVKEFAEGAVGVSAFCPRNSQKLVV